MRKFVTLLAAGGALVVAAPAMAQLGGVAGGVTGSVAGGVNTTLDPVGTTSGVVDNTTGRGGTVVGKADSTVQNRVDNTRLSLASTQDLTAGAHVRDSQGHSLGTVQSVSGNQAVVVDGSKVYNVPVSQIYAKGTGKARQLMTNVPRASLSAQASANANTAANTGG